jgi:hypothetical protein
MLESWNILLLPSNDRPRLASSPKHGIAALLGCQTVFTRKKIRWTTIPHIPGLA